MPAWVITLRHALIADRTAIGFSRLAIEPIGPSSAPDRRAIGGERKECFRGGSEPPGKMAEVLTRTRFRKMSYLKQTMSCLKQTLRHAQPCARTAKPLGINNVKHAACA